MARLGWPEGHGERLRKERREFAREEADTLAKSLMAGIERRQLGETRRAKITEAGRMTGIEREEVGATRRVGIKETGLGERLKREQEFARPLQTAEAGRLKARTGLREAEAEKVRYGTEFERGVEDILKDIIGAKGRLGEAVAEERELGLSEERRRLRFGEEAETEIEAARPLMEELPPALARPEGRAKPLSKKILDFTLPGRGVSILRDLFRRGEREEYAYPGVR